MKKENIKEKKLNKKASLKVTKKATPKTNVKKENKNNTKPKKVGTKNSAIKKAKVNKSTVKLNEDPLYFNYIKVDNTKKTESISPKSFSKELKYPYFSKIKKIKRSTFDFVENLKAELHRLNVNVQTVRLRANDCRISIEKRISYLYKTKIKDNITVKSIVNSIAKFNKKIIEKIKQQIKSIINKYKMKKATIIPDIKAFIDNIVDTFKNVTSKIASNIKEFVKNPIKYIKFSFKKLSLRKKRH